MQFDLFCPLFLKLCIYIPLIIVTRTELIPNSYYDHFFFSRIITRSYMWWTLNSEKVKLRILETLRAKTILDLAQIQYIYIFIIRRGDFKSYNKEGERKGFECHIRDLVVTWLMFLPTKWDLRNSQKMVFTQSKQHQPVMHSLANKIFWNCPVILPTMEPSCQII